MSNREFIHDIVLQVAVIVAFFAIMSAITSWNCARCDLASKNAESTKTFATFASFAATNQAEVAK